MGLPLNQRIALFFVTMRHSLRDVSQEMLAKSLHSWAGQTQADVLRQVREVEQQGTGSVAMFKALAGYYDLELPYFVQWMTIKRIKDKERWLRQWIRDEEDNPEINRDFNHSLVVEHPGKHHPRYRKVSMNQNDRREGVQLARQYARKNALRVCLIVHSEKLLGVWFGPDGSILEFSDEADGELGHFFLDCMWDNLNMLCPDEANDDLLLAMRLVIVYAAIGKWRYVFRLPKGDFTIRQIVEDYQLQNFLKRRHKLPDPKDYPPPKQIKNKEAWLLRWIRGRGEPLHCWQELHVQHPGKPNLVKVNQYGSNRMEAFEYARKYAKEHGRRVKLLFVGETLSVWIGPDGSIQDIVIAPAVPATSS